MSDSSISIVPRLSVFPGKEAKAREILDWLLSRDMVKPTLSDCILGSSDEGYAISEGAKDVSTEPDQLPFGLQTNGLDIITRRTIFHTGGLGIEEVICPNCKNDFSNEDWSFLDEWHDKSKNWLTCPLCKQAADIHQFKFTPEWGFSDLGFTFWNWSELTDEFVNEFRTKLGCDVNLVYARI